MPSYRRSQYASVHRRSCYAKRCDRHGLPLHHRSRLSTCAAAVPPAGLAASPAVTRALSVPFRASSLALAALASATSKSRSALAAPACPRAVAAPSGA